MMSRGVHYLILVISASLVIFFGLIFLSLSFLCMRRVSRWRQSWANLTVFEGYTLIMGRRQTLELAFDLALTMSWLISLYSLIASCAGGEFW